MPVIRFEGDSFVCNDGESVLECLRRNGREIPFSCLSGVCGTCILRAIEGIPPSTSQASLKDTLRAQGYFLSCSCRPTSDMEVALGDGVGARVPAVLTAIEPLNPTVVRVRARAEKPFDYRAGQFASLLRHDGLARTYSLASVPGIDPELEFHVARVPGGAMSEWLHRDAVPGMRIELLGPRGDCFYVPGNPDQPLFLLGTGTGLAPLYGILRDAIHQGHRGPIHLFQGGLTRDGLYLVDELREIAPAHANVAYHPCVRDADPADPLHGAIDEVAQRIVPNLKGWRVYLCGHPDMVTMMRKKTFLAGASMKEIFADAFIPSPKVS